MLAEQHKSGFGAMGRVSFPTLCFSRYASLHRKLR